MVNSIVHLSQFFGDGLRKTLDPVIHRILLSVFNEDAYLLLGARVSLPITTRFRFGPEERSTCATACPTFIATSGVIGNSFARPRMPSVPNNCTGVFYRWPNENQPQRHIMRVFRMAHQRTEVCCLMENEEYGVLLRFESYLGDHLQL